ncbi:restriction endonuclease subunit S [Yoonia sp.]|uniref:restriction endonuclease subunit S n=1 Tax=Yoonia sp. TaxID=2212373 RepID=UPI002E0CE2DC|nr:restriction endonuclease subunit S [Yoonia sp.]
MKADRLLELYEEISDASDAIARLRDVVLEVGVRGKLNEQDDAETVSPEFLNETSDPKFPANWRTLNFGKYCNIEGGNQPPKSQFVDTPRDGYVRLFQIRDLGERPVPVFIPETSTKRFSVEGEILIGRYGASVGKVFWAQNGAYNVALAKFIFPANAFLPDFAFRLLKSSFFQKALEGASRTAQAGFNKGDLAHIDFPLPPLAEQHRIVAKVDELMALCDQLEQARAGREAVRDRLTTASLARLTAPDNDAETFQSHARFALQSLPTLTTRPDQIKPLRQTILNLAVRGKLVAQDAADEPAAELLKRIAQEKARLVKSGQIKDRTSPRRNGDAAELSVPQGWVVSNLQTICTSVTDGDHLPPPKAEQGVPFLVIGDVRTQTIEFSGNRFVSQEYYDALDSIRRPRAGDLLYTLVGSYGIPVIVRDDRAFCVQRHIGILRPSKQVDLGFLARVMESQFIFDQATECATGIAQKTVPLSGLRNIAIPLPPLAEQHRIVAKVDALMALCDQLEASLTTATTTRQRLLTALLHEALEPATLELEAAE